MIARLDEGHGIRPEDGLPQESPPEGSSTGRRLIRGSPVLRAIHSGGTILRSKQHGRAGPRACPASHK